jgi:hypothetical protein
MPKIIQDLGFPEDASAELVWQEFPLRLTTWRIKELVVKQSRWFSWHDAASEAWSLLSSAFPRKPLKMHM